MQNEPSRVPIRIRTNEPEVRGANRTFVRDFTIGRDRSCDVRVQSGLVSRVHAGVTYENGRWWVYDNESTNGSYLDGEQIRRVPLPAETTLRLGQGGPTFQLSIEGDPSEPLEDATYTEGRASDAASTMAEPEQGTGPNEGTTSPSEPLRASSASASASRPDPSVSQYVEYYFNDQDRPAGEHTQMLRQAYQRVQSEERQKYTWAIVGVLALSVLLGAYALMQHLRNERHEQTAEKMFMGLKEQGVLITQLKRRIEESEDASLTEQLQSLEEQRQKMQTRYVGYVEELGLYRELTPREREIYRVARIFGESEFSIPAGFVRRVKETIENFWLREPHRSDYVSAIQRAKQNGYIAPIVETMRAHGLPPEFFYLALQESKFREKAVGPPTRWGIAKGMWQFIPRTARRFGLRVGPREDTAVCEPQDERCDFEKATAAAARYLQAIYSTKAQASGLLVIASYNWGEHRVVDKLGRVPRPQSIPPSALEGIPKDPQARNYWRFLNEYSDRMPEQTKDYVLKIFAAAAIGQNPRLFGFSFDNPLHDHIERAAQQSSVS